MWRPWPENISLMNTVITFQKGAEISPEKYMEIMKEAARLVRGIARLADDAETYMGDRLVSGMSTYEDKSYQNLEKAIEETRLALSLLEKTKESKVNFELFG